MKKIILFLYLIVFFIFTGCGYESIYSKNVYKNKDLLSISVKNIKDRSGQILRNSLLNNLNPDRERVIKKYKLIVEISESKSSLAFRRDMSATRTDLEVTAKYLLTDIKNGEIKYPLSETMVSGNIQKMFENLDEVSSDRIDFGSGILPWISFKGITIS